MNKGRRAERPDPIDCNVQRRSGIIPTRFVVVGAGNQSCSLNVVGLAGTNSGASGEIGE